MVENVQTGGLKNFRRSGEEPKLSDEQKKEIEDAYKRADERKAEEKRKRRIYWIIGFLILILIIAGVYFLVK
jgi:hypothetical protein